MLPKTRVATLRGNHHTGLESLGTVRILAFAKGQGFRNIEKLTNHPTCIMFGEVCVDPLPQTVRGHRHPAMIASSLGGPR